MCEEEWMKSRAQLDYDSFQSFPNAFGTRPAFSHTDRGSAGSGGGATSDAKTSRGIDKEVGFLPLLSLCMLYTCLPQVGTEQGTRGTSEAL